MARKEKMSEGKKNIIVSLIQEYDIHTTEDIQDALKDLLEETIQDMMEAEMDHHLDYKSYERSDNTNARNGHKPKSVRRNMVKFKWKYPRIFKVLLNHRLFVSVKKIFHR